MKKILSILLIFTFSFSLCSCKNKKSPDAQIIKYNLESEPKSLDPQIANDYSSNIVIMNLFEGLTRADSEGNALPGVAYSWDANSDFTSYTFHLRNDATWANKNKTPVTAEDFVFGFQRALDKKTNSPLAVSLYCIKNAKKVNLSSGASYELGVHSVDNNTLKIDLEYSNKDFPKLVSTSPTMPCNKEFFESCTGQYGLENKTVLGNGPFKIKSRYGWDHFNSIQLFKNENYVGAQKPIPAGISFSIGKDISNAVDLIKDEVLDAALLPIGQFKKAQNENFNMVSFDDTIWGLTFNISDSLFSNLSLRKSIITSLNRTYILSNIPDNCSITENIVLKKLLIGSKTFEEVSQKDMYLKEDRSSNTYLDRGLKELKLKSLPKVTIICLNTPEVKAMVSNIIENLNNKLNYHFNMNPISLSELNSKINNSDYQVAVAPMTAQSDSALEFLSMFRSNNEKNILKLKSVEYDKMLEKASFAEPEESIKLLVEAERYLHNNAMIYPLYVESRYFASAKNLSGIIFHKYKRGIDFMLAKKQK
ncbi:MAG: oligopeptide transport system substrate-binding protein [Eubacteriales bacterium SKADARSKE-1]|nr:oligopeptide transport system substrate-binding protein [Eubacteriales bacterium SKADARSKE-1]